MVRALYEVMKIPEMDFITSQLHRPDEKGNVIYRKMLANGYKELDVPASALILMQMPPFIEQYTHFILNNASKFNFNKHLGWMLDKLEINQSTISEYLLIDYIRYVLHNTEHVHQHTGEKVHRWYIIGWIIKYVKSDIYKMLSKQALFFDWLFFKGESGMFKVFEPVWLFIYNSVTKYKEMTEEMLDFLFLFAKE